MGGGFQAPPTALSSLPGSWAARSPRPQRTLGSDQTSRTSPVSQQPGAAVVTLVWLSQRASHTSAVIVAEAYFKCELINHVTAPRPPTPPPPAEHAGR